LSNLYAQAELLKTATVRNFRTVQKEGAREVARMVDFYNLDAIIAVGFRVNSTRAIQFRQWATTVLRDFAIRGYVLDKERLKNGAFFNKAYFEDLLSEIREIRASERKFYQKITDIYATAMDYSADEPAFKAVQHAVEHLGLPLVQAKLGRSRGSSLPNCIKLQLQQNTQQLSVLW
jgi:hypothetical protein